MRFGLGGGGQERGNPVVATEGPPGGQAGGNQDLSGVGDKGSG